MKIGFIGLGQMGSAMAANLLKAGHKVTLWNRSFGKAGALVAAGARLAVRPADTVQGDVVEAVVFGEGGIRNTPALYVSHGTISIALVDQLTAEAGPGGYASAPVFGRSSAAQADKLSVIAAGAPAAIDSCDSLFAAIDQCTYRIGDRPSAAIPGRLAEYGWVASKGAAQLAMLADLPDSGEIGEPPRPSRCRTPIIISMKSPRPTCLVPARAGWTMAMTEPSMPPGGGADGRFAGVIAHVMLTPKGGAGKTETADVLEAALTLSGKRCLPVDVDDGDRWLSRRIGAANLIKLRWESGASDASEWVTTHVTAVDDLIFDLGAGISSSDTPIMACLSGIRRILWEGGGRVSLHAILSTNASKAGLIERAASTCGRIASLIVVRNNQDNSGQFPADLSPTFPVIDLDHLAGGLQAVRLLRHEPMSAIIQQPTPGYALATAMIAARVRTFAAQMPVMPGRSLKRSESTIGEAATAPTVMFAIRRLSQATDDRIARNARLLETHRRLLAPDITDPDLLAGARAYRRAYQAYRNST